MGEKHHVDEFATTQPDEDIMPVKKLEEFEDPSEADEALRYAMESKGLVIDPKTDRKLLWKIDLYICPLMCLVYTIQYMDKISNSYASVMGIQEDLEMKGEMYSFTGTGFYLGYLVAELPIAWLLQRLPLAKLTGGLIFCWGIVICCMASPTNYAGFESLRVLLGVFESGISPAFVLLTSQWYKSNETFLRTSIWFAFNGMGTIVGAVIAHALYEREQTVGLPIESWRLLFLIIGSITVLLGVAFYLHIPDVPSKAWFLTHQERLMVVERIRSNKQGFGSRKFKKYQMIEAFKDPRTYLIILYNLVNLLPNGGLTNFSAIVLSSMGYDNSQALLMNTPAGAVEVVALISAGIIGQFAQRRMGIGLGAALVFLVPSLCMLAFAKSEKAQLAGFYLYQASPISYVMILSIISSSCLGTTKKQTVQALNFVSYAVGNMIGPLTFRENEKPDYPTAKIVMVVCSCICAVDLACLYLLNIRENRKRDKANVKLNIENSEFADLTDFENPEFRYPT